MENVRKSAIKIAFLSVVLAMATHLYLALLHFDLKTGTASGSSICSINEKFNCEAVAMSPYSELLGAPIALWAFFFSSLIFVLLIAFSSSGEKSYYRWATTLATVSVVASIAMATIALTKMSTLCLFCIFAYVLSAILLMSLWLVTKDSKFINAQDIKNAFSDKKVLVGLILVPVLTLLVNDMNLRKFKNATKTLIYTSIQEWNGNPTTDFSEFTGLKKGPDNARVKIVEFVDYLCPHCMHAAPMLEGFTLSHPDTQLIFYPFPLDSTCNPAIEMSDGGLRCVLAKATLCGDKQGKGWDIYNWAFKNFGDKSVLTVSELSKVHGLNEVELQACIDSTEIAKAIATNGSKGKESGVKGTPSVFVNGKQLPGGNLLVVLEALYKSL